jgi:diguanylate cyclase (GGDEF)-like protein
MDKQLQEALDYIIRNKQIKTVFQPIISLKDGSVLGHEALSRMCCESAIQNPEMLFVVAGECNRIWELELLCRTVALETAFKFMVPPYNKKLFINVNPNLINDDSFKKGFTKKFLAEYGITPSQVIFEITERNVIKNMRRFKDSVSHYKGQEYKIAIDDAGAGYSGLNLISEVSPDYIKLDMKLIRDIDRDRIKYALVKGMVEFSRAANVELIAEGIETYEELETLVKLGVQYGQGYFIQKPDEKVKEVDGEMVKMLKEIELKKNNPSHNVFSDTYISSLCTYTNTIAPKETVVHVYNRFKNDPNCFGLCVVEKEKAIGIITQEKLLLKLSGQYGFTLNQNKYIYQLMDRDFLSVDYKTPIHEVSALAMARPNNKLYDLIVITEEEKFIGVVTIKDLLQKTTEIEISTAKHQNPLTNLPGNFIIEQVLKGCVENCQVDCKEYSVTYLDIDNFKAYNDLYGFENGDLVIKLLANTLREYIPAGQFIGHVGGDDFVVVLDHLNTQEILTQVKVCFETEVLKLYHKEDVQKGYVITENRHGVIERFPLITLTIVSVNNRVECFKNVYELTEVLAKLKKIEKQNKIFVS